MANNPYVNKVVFGSATLVDLTGTTATADKILTGYGAFGADGAWMDGTATGGSGDGYVWQDAQGYVHLSDEEGTGIIIDSLTVNNSGTYTAPLKHAYSPVTVPSGSATTPMTTIPVTPSISVNSSGLITASASGSQSVTPTVSSGWVSSGTAGAVSVSGTNTAQLTTQSATTITPTTIDQTIASGKYLTGAITVKGDENLIAANIAKDVEIFGITGTHEGGSSASGIKYLYSDVNGEGAWDNISGYEYYSYDYAPIRDNKLRLWVKVNATNGFTVTPVIYAREKKVTIDWGDGTSEYATGSSPFQNSHTYSTDGTYCIEVSDPTNNRMNLRDYAMGQSASEPNTTLVGVELYSTGSVTYLANTFAYCINLKKVTIVNGKPNSYFFMGCSSLKTVKFVGTETAFAQRMFDSCYDLQSIQLPSSLTDIGNYVFQNCESLHKITIPSTVTSIGAQCFYGCRRLLEIHVLPTTPPTLDGSSFDGIPSDCIIYVPSASLEAYQTATNWSTYASYMQGE